MQIVAVFVIFNEAQFIREALESVAWCDKIIVVDGAFEGFPTDSAVSNDGTIEIVEKFMLDYLGKVNVVWITRDKPWIGNSKVKRYLSEIRDGDYFLRMNGDEICESLAFNIRERVERYIKSTGNLPLYTVHEYRPPLMDGHFDWMPRLLRKTPNLKVSGKHPVLENDFDPPYKLGAGRNGVYPLEANIPSAVISLRHMCDHRDSERKRLNHEWTKIFNAKVIK
ncbi:MAG: hypothetical protein WC365_04345 [Candidatus Babeliales bacterium]